MEGKHRHTQHKSNKSNSKLNPCDEKNEWLSDDGFKLRITDRMRERQVVDAHDFSSLCNEAFVSLELDEYLNHYFGSTHYWAVLNDHIILRLQPCSLVSKDEIVLDANQRLSLGGVQSPDIVHLKRWNQTSSNTKCSQIWVTITNPLPQWPTFPQNIVDVEQIMQTKLLGHVVTKGQTLLFDTSRDAQIRSKMFDVVITDIIGGKNAEGSLARGLIEKNTIIRAFPGDNKTAWLTRTPPINKWRYDFDVKLLEKELNKLEIGGLALSLKSVLEGVFGHGSLPLPYCSSLSLAQRKVKGVILYGPPKTGKASLARSMEKILGTAEAKIIKTTMTPKALLSLFREAITDDMINRCWRALGFKNGGRDRLHLFIVDDVEGLHLTDQPSACSATRDRAATLSTLIDRLDNILIIGTTRHFHRVEPNVLRADRFGLHVKIELPDKSARSDILKMYIRRMNKKECMKETDFDTEELASYTDGYTPLELFYLVRGAIVNAMRRLTPTPGYYAFFDIIADGTKVGMDDFYSRLKVSMNILE